MLTRQKLVLLLVCVLAIISSLQASVNNWQNLKSFFVVIRAIRAKHHVTIDTTKPICCIPKENIAAMIDAIKDATTHPLQRFLIAAVLSRIPIMPLRHVLNWNEYQYREMQRFFNVTLSARGDMEVRTLIIRHEEDEADAIDLFPSEHITLGERLSCFIAYLIKTSIPDEADLVIGSILKDVFLPNCVSPGAPSIFHFIKSGILDQHLGDHIDAIMGTCRELSLIQCGVASAHVDPYVLIKESNRVFEMQTESGRDFAMAMREFTGELEALRAAGLDYGNEYRDPHDVALRRAIKIQFDVGQTMLRNLYR